MQRIDTAAQDGVVKAMAVGLRPCCGPDCSGGAPVRHGTAARGGAARSTGKDSRSLHLLFLDLVRICPRAQAPVLQLLVLRATEIPIRPTIMEQEILHFL
jgi:hypothetical protein